jgi:predicted RecB family nuclease
LQIGVGFKWKVGHNDHLPPVQMFSATQIANFLACPHTATLDRAEAKNEIVKPFFKDETVELLQKLGLQHEHRYLSELVEKDGLNITRVNGNGSWSDAAEATLRAIREGSDVIYQGAFLQAPWGGRPDFLLRVDKPSKLGAWSYEVVETKLARWTKASALMQLCFYSDLLARIQDIEPEWMHIVLGGGANAERFRVQSYIAYFRGMRRDFEQAWKLETETYPDPTEHCNVCSWFPICDERRRRDDYLSLVAAISRHQRKILIGNHVGTVVALAQLPVVPGQKLDGIGGAALWRIHEQARLQVQGRDEDRLIYELIECEAADSGLAALPEPSEGDIFLDLEGNPYVFDHGLEYLIGAVTLAAGPDANYEPVWALNQSEEKRAFEHFVAFTMQRRRVHPDLHIFHYATYEPSAFKRLAGRHGTCVEEVDELLRAGVFVDLYRIVRQSLRASVESYSIKRLEPLYGFSRVVPLKNANEALTAFEGAMALGIGDDDTKALLKTIEGYNRDDCVSLVYLRDWLEQRRKELETRLGHGLSRPQVKSGEPTEALSGHLQEVHAIRDRLLARLPEDQTAWSNEDRASWLLAQLLEWHRREEKSTWWEYFRLCNLSDAELQEDINALGGLTFVGEIGVTSRSVTYRYSFPPQEHSIGRALGVHDPRTRKSAGQLESVDDATRTVDLRRKSSSPGPHPTALIPVDIVSSTVLRDSLLRISTWVADHAISTTGRFEVGRRLLLREPLLALREFAGPLIGTDGQLTTSARTLVRSLANTASVLPIQGPPGSGKTFTGARMIVDLVLQGCRVGITAVSHKVIGNLLREACRTADAAGVTLRPMQKADSGNACNHPCVAAAESNEDVVEAIANGAVNVVAGSAWLWAREEMANAVDVLFVDEAGQMSLANVLAISPATTSLVLLGDPQQLDQPQKGVHPPGAEVSALGHVLNGKATIAPEQGLFLSETRRLHPDVCAFTSEVFYEGRLEPRPENSIQRINAEGPFAGTGLRFVVVEHSGNQNESPEEADRIAGLVHELIRSGATWTNVRGEKCPLNLRDILVVAPYNAQVSAIAKRFPTGARVGTVDKFQGQEAPIVFYSMATSNPDDAPRGMEFLYSLNRLNVAISRARCVAILVANPALFRLQCKNPRQMELANAFCRYLEMAHTV